MLLPETTGYNLKIQVFWDVALFETRIVLPSDLVWSNPRREDRMIPKKEALRSLGNYLPNGIA
jgi:hypothetical protein